MQTAHVDSSLLLLHNSQVWEFLSKYSPKGQVVKAWYSDLVRHFLVELTNIFVKSSHLQPD